MIGSGFELGSKPNHSNSSAAYSEFPFVGGIDADEQHHQPFCRLPLRCLIWYRITQILVFTVGKYNIEMIYI